MKDLELIVYIIAGLIYFIARNYRKVQQNRPGQQPAPLTLPDPQLPANPEIKKTKNAGTDAAGQQPANKIPYQTMKRQNLATEYKPIQKPDDDYHKRETESTRNFFENSLTSGESSQPVISEEQEEIKPFLLADDLKKAVVYAEILRRPYY
jgi:hypothetical protein